ncbi:MAG: hypothetical protein IJ407_01100 [Clostridia bacterium]|nr:hypothetical protein [Clostridia bacterium]
MKKLKVLGLSLCAVLLIAASVLGTLAYLTAQDTVTNTFTVGQVDITLDETKVTPDGVPVEGVPRVKENNYHLIPGMTYVKDPTMTVVKGSEKSYVRMLVTINRYEELTAIFGTPFLPQYFVSGWDKDVWVSTEKINVEANTATYEFRYYETVDASDGDITLDALFDTITLPGDVTGAQLKTISDLEINVVGHAIQKAGFDDENAAWTAFDAQIG